MKWPRVPVHLLLPAALVVLVVALAFLQYRWLGQVSQAERQQMRASLERRAGDFATDFDREITGLHDLIAAADNSGTREQVAVDLGRRLIAWRASARFPDLVKDIYLAAPETGGDTIERLVPDTGRLEPTGWPTDLAPVRTRLTTGATREASGPEVRTRLLVLGGPPVVVDAPALLIWLPSPLLRGLATAESTARPEIGPLRRAPLSDRLAIVHLDRDVLINGMLRVMVDRHFGTDAVRLQVVDAGGRELLRRVLADTEVIPRDRADVVMPFFSARGGEDDGTPEAERLLAWTVGAPPDGNTPPVDGTADGRVRVRIERDQIVRRVPLPPGPDRWQLLVQHGAGSLDQAVALARRRNLYLSFGILSVLVAAIGLVLGNARKAGRLAAQQMEFVATVSHELRTPVAVIRSAAENLAAGIVTDPAQTRRYGDLIETEGRRLTDMVEQVLAHAGINSNHRSLRLAPVDPGDVIRSVVDSMRPVAAEAGFTIEVQVDPATPLVRADESALKGVLESLLINAIKHAAEGRWVSISARGSEGPEQREVEIGVSDRGPGIDAADRQRIFEPFYRGRAALDRQIKGSGLGLSLVKRTVSEHGGHVWAANLPDGGARFVIRLPAIAEPVPGRGPVASGPPT